MDNLDVVNPRIGHGGRLAACAGEYIFRYMSTCMYLYVYMYIIGRLENRRFGRI